MKAIVLKKRAYGDFDLIIDFFLESNERLSCFASGARKSKKRFPHQFHPMAIYDLDLGPQRDSGHLQRLISAELLEFFGGYDLQIESFSRWSIIQEFCLLESCDGVSFEKVCFILRNLPLNPRLDEYLEFFNEQMISHGLQPQIEHCVFCGEGFVSNQKPLSFIFHEGGLAHRSCAHGFPIHPASFEYLKNRFHGAGSSLLVPSPSTFLEMEELLIRYLEIHLEKNLKSHLFLQQLMSPQGSKNHLL